MSTISRMSREIRDGRRPRVLDLFSGCGGLSLGFLRAGYEIAAGMEIDAHACSSHALNFWGDSSEDVGARHSQPLDIS